MKKEGVYFASGKEYSNGIVVKDALHKGEPETAPVKSHGDARNQDYVWWLI